MAVRRCDDVGVGVHAVGEDGGDLVLPGGEVPEDRGDGLVGTLAAEGITAAAFPADVLDRDSLTQARMDAAAHLGGIDVLEYSPSTTRRGRPPRSRLVRLLGAAHQQAGPGGNRLQGLRLAAHGRRRRAWTGRWSLGYWDPPR